MRQFQEPILGDSARKSNFKAFRLHDIHNCGTSLELGLSEPVGQPRTIA